MLSGKWLRSTGILVLFFFAWFSLSADFTFAQEDDELLAARQLYQQGDYEGSIKILSDFISKLRAIVAQKKNVAEAFYLLAKVYYTVGEDSKVDENLRKVFETYPAFTANEQDFEFKARAERAKAEAASARAADTGETEAVPGVEDDTGKPTRVIEAPAKKKKKKFPVLLVVGGLAVIALAAVLLGGGKDATEEPFNIRGNWIFNESWPRFGDFQTFITFSGGLAQGNFRNQEDLVGAYEVNGKQVTLRYTDYEVWVYNGAVLGPDNMGGTARVKTNDGSIVHGTWTAHRGGQGANTPTSLSTGNKLSTVKRAAR
jgi:hypothetical protein